MHADPSRRDVFARTHRLCNVCRMRRNFDGAAHGVRRVCMVVGARAYKLAQGELRHLVASAMQEVKVYGGAKYVTPHSNLVHVRATQQFGTSRHPWYDCAIVRCDASDDPEEEKWQLGYVQIGTALPAKDQKNTRRKWYVNCDHSACWHWQTWYCKNPCKFNLHGATTSLASANHD